MGVKEQITDMLDALNHKETPNTEAPPAEETVASPPATEQPVEEPEETPVTEEPKEAPATEPPVDELAMTKAELAKLREEFEELKKAKEPPATEAPDLRFIEENEDLDEITRDPTEFNKVLNKVSRVTRDGVIAGIMKDLPGTYAVIDTVKKAVDKFYTDNADLTNHKQDVVKVYGELQTAHQDWDTDKLLVEVSNETRKRLGIQKPVSHDKATDSRQKPNLPPGSKGGKRVVEKPKGNSLVDEIAEMNAVR